MDLSQLLNQGGKVKIEVSIDDLATFAEFILERYSKENKVIANQAPEFGGVDFASNITGYSKSSIYTFVNKNQVPFKKVHGKLWFSRSELEKWINSGSMDNKLLKYTK